MKKYILLVVCICVLAVCALSACSKSTSAPSESQNADSYAETSSGTETKVIVPIQGPAF